MKSTLRIFLELFGPPAISSLSLFFYSVLLNDALASLNDLAGALFVGYLFTIIPSLVCTVIMEQKIKRGLHLKTWQGVGFASVLGLLTGGAFSLLMSPLAYVGFRGTALEWFMTCVIFTLDGLWTGFVMGLLLKILARWGDRKKI
jgi:hypothetical protein